MISGDSYALKIIPKKTVKAHHRDSVSECAFEYCSWRDIMKGGLLYIWGPLHWTGITGHSCRLPMVLIGSLGACTPRLTLGFMKSGSEESELIHVSKNPRMRDLTLNIFLQVLREIAIHYPLRHDHVVRLYSAFEDIENIYMILEYCQGEVS